MADPVTIDIRKLKLDQRLQMRVSMDDDAVEDYCDNLFDLPPVKACEDDKGILWVWDGFHTVTASLKMKQHVVKVVITPGSFMDALALAAGANASHGLRRSPEDKRRAVLSLLEHQVWRERSDRMIADTCKVSHPLVARVRKEVESNTEPSKPAEDSNNTGKKKRPTGKSSSSNGAASGTRTGKDGKARKPVDPAKLRCDRCKRLKVDKPDCPACQALRRNAAERQQERQQKEGEDASAILDDEGYIVPAALRSVFEGKELYRSAEVAACKVASLFTDLEATSSYADANKGQEDKFRYSNLFRTAGAKAKNLRPASVCQECKGEGCSDCKKKGYLTVGEREEHNSTK